MWCSTGSRSTASACSLPTRAAAAARECSVYRDLEYHAVLDQRVADYIRSRWPRKTIGVSGWGMDFEDAESLPRLVQLSRTLDYILDVHGTNRSAGPTIAAN